MNCRFCGTDLPADAAFCSECGRRVPAPPTSAAALADSEFSCPQCGAAITEDDVFCAECGFVLASSYLSAPVDALGDPIDTDALSGHSGRAAGPTGSGPGHPLDPAAADSGGVQAHAAPGPAAVARAPQIRRAAPDPFPWGKDPRLPPVDLEATRVSAVPPAEERFVLQFSTGESVVVSGAGLVGRNPASQPGEVVDHLVTIFDAGKSVSKTHLEFGQDGGRFWVSDRYSTNGSTVRQPDAEPKRCEPGRRYVVARGTRVDIGDQFFVVS